MAYVGAFEAPTKLAELQDRVEGGETVTIARHGKLVARLVPITAEGESARMRRVISENKRWRTRNDRGAGPGTAITELIKAGRHY